MPRKRGLSGGVFFVTILMVVSLIGGFSYASSKVEEGRKIATTRKLGNCVSCHFLPNIESPGNAGPNLVESMKNYTEADRDIVRQWIEDPRQFNPDTLMPPFGANKILTKEQIDAVVEYLYSLKGVK
ncbi:MAG: sulfur oxidation c-type cytochrome SoxX [Nitrospirae bacterium]|nr:sulfur oxidation c-type cytochrome SoxX [Nitrospirota bacterium]